MAVRSEAFGYKLYTYVGNKNYVLDYRKKYFSINTLFSLLNKIRDNIGKSVIFEKQRKKSKKTDYLNKQKNPLSFPKKSMFYTRKKKLKFFKIS